MTNDNLLNNNAAAELVNEFGRQAPLAPDTIPIQPPYALAAPFNILTPIARATDYSNIYPTELMPDRFRDAIYALSTIADCHHNTAAWALFSSVSAAAQCIAQVETPAGPNHIVPVSTYTHLIAASGTRKSTCFAIAWRGITDADAELQREHHKRRASLAAQQKGKGNRTVTTDQELCRGAGTIKQLVTEPSTEALVRDAKIGFPYPAIASPEGAAWYQGYSAASDANRTIQTASILSSGHSSEPINIARIGADGKAPNRSLDAGDYAVGMHFAVQDSSMGYNIILGPASEHGMSSRILLAESPQPEIKLPTRPPHDELERANSVMTEWRNHIYAIRQQVDHRILQSESGAVPRAVIALNETTHQAIAKTLDAFIALESITAESDRIVFDRLPEQICRIAATLFVAEQPPLQPGQRYELPPKFITAAGCIAIYHWRTRQRLAGIATDSEIDECCQSIADIALQWHQDGSAGSRGLRGYNPATETFGWSKLLQASKHTGPRGRRSKDTDFKLALKARVFECGVFAPTIDRRVALNPEYITERQC